VEALVVRFARENRGWRYDRIVGALANLGHPVSDRTVGNILRRHHIAPAPERSRTTSWKEFIRSHTDVLAAADFFTVEVLTWQGLVTYYVLFFIAVGSRRVSLGGITRHPEAGWVEQVARNASMQDNGYLNGCRYLLHDRDQKFCRQFRETLAAGGVQCLPLPARSPNLNAYAERWVRSIKEECLAKLILFGERSLQRVVSNYLEHYQERHHQGKGQSLAVSGPCGGGKFARSDPLSGAARRLTQVLQPRRMSTFTIRPSAQARKACCCCPSETKIENLAGTDKHDAGVGPDTVETGVARRRARHCTIRNRKPNGLTLGSIYAILFSSS
jgi:hypothetical protein